MSNATAPPPSLTCPVWCTEGDEHRGDHWRSGEYVPAPRSTPTHVGPDGAHLPSVAAHLAQFKAGPLDLVIHVGASTSSDDAELRFGLDDAIIFAARLVETIAAGLEGESTGIYPDALIMLEQATAEVLKAHARPGVQETGA